MVAVPRPFTTLLADPSDLFRTGLRSLLRHDKRFHLVGESASNPTAAAQRLQPDLILLDPARGGVLDLNILDDLHRAAPSSRIAIHTAAFQPQSFMAAMLKRVHGYFPKGAAPDGQRLLDTLVPVAQSRVVSVGPTIAGYFWSLPGTTIQVHEPQELTPALTERQRAVLTLFLQDMDDKAIADRLHIDRSTVEYHVEQARLRLGVGNRIRLGWVLHERGLL